MPGVTVHHIHRTLPQEPEDGDPNFWYMWADFLSMFGAQPGDLLVASELYGLNLAEHTGLEFIPFDIGRQINPIRATRVRSNVSGFIRWVLPEFQPYLIQTTTIFGAESVGKTTLTKEMDWAIGAHRLFEYARPYLETVGPELTTEKMRRIHDGQRALQELAQQLRNQPHVVQDTDLFSTVGYWELHPELGRVPEGLYVDATRLMSDLYIMPRSNIPFESDPLRYGGNEREASDDYWIALAERFELNLEFLDSVSPEDRLEEAREKIWDHYDKNFQINYTREGEH